MKLTNKYGLPKTFVNAIQRDFHKGADYSASGFTKPIQMVQLEKRHKGEMAEDVMDNIWSLFGTAVHGVLESGEGSEQLVEQYMEEKVGDLTVSGMPDLLEDKILFDYKVTSAWTYVFIADKMWDYTIQTNIYKWFFEKAGFEVEKIKIVLILRDWQATNARRDPAGYPQQQVQLIDVPLYKHGVMQAYIENRIGDFESYNAVEDEFLPECTKKERWGKDSTWAVMKEGVKKASKIVQTEEDGVMWIRNAIDTGKKGKFSVVKREGDMWKRCEYCRVQPFCHQWKEGHKDDPDKG